MSVISLRTKAKTLLEFHKFVQSTAGQEMWFPWYIYVYFPPKKAANYNISPRLDFDHWNGFCTRYFLYFHFPFPMLFSVLFFPLSIPKQKGWWERRQNWKCVIFNVSKIDFYSWFLKGLEIWNTGGYCNKCPILLCAKQNQIITTFCWNVFQTCLPLILQTSNHGRVPSLLPINTFLRALLSVLNAHGANGCILCAEAWRSSQQ